MAAAEATQTPALPPESPAIHKTSSASRKPTAGRAPIGYAHVGNALLRSYRTELRMISSKGKNEGVYVEAESLNRAQRSTPSLLRLHHFVNHYLATLVG